MGMSLDRDGWAACTKAKIEALRNSARGFTAADGTDMQALKAREIETRIELNEIEIAVKSGELLRISELEPQLANMVVATRSELKSSAVKIADEIQLTYGVDIDPLIISRHIETALKNISNYQPVIYGETTQDEREFEEE
jgi:hypothetical protein